MLWLNEGDKEVGPWKYGLLMLMWLLSFLMLSEIHYPSFKKINWRTRRTLPWMFVIILVAVCAVIFWHVVPAILFTAYLLYGGVRPWVSRKWRREIEEDGGESLVEVVHKDDDGEDESAA